MELTPFRELVKREQEYANSNIIKITEQQKIIYKNQDFLLKYEPTSFDDFVGNQYNLKNVLTWVNSPPEETESAAILLAPSGVGKSLLIKLLVDTCNSSQLEIKNLSEKTDQDIEQIISGKTNTKSIIDLFKEEDDQEPSSKPKNTIFTIDNVDSKITTEKDYIPKLQKKLKKNSRLFLTASVNIIKKLNKLKQVKLFAFTRVENKELKPFVQKIIRLERKRSSEDFGDHVFNQSNGDVRATLKNLEILLVKKSRDIVMLRDQDILVTDIAKKFLYYDVEGSVIDTRELSFQRKMYLSESDTYCLVYSLHENYISRLSDIDDLSNIADDFSYMDLIKANDLSFETYLDSMFGAVIPSERIKNIVYDEKTGGPKKKKLNKELRPYKIISSSNQRIISKNKVETAAKSFKIYEHYPYEELLEIIKLRCSLEPELKDKHSWFFNRFGSKKKQTSKKEVVLST